MVQTRPILIVEDERIAVGFRRRPLPAYYIKDNGQGIETRYLKKVFNLFERLISESEGSGVGLPIVKRIVELHGGRIWAESRGLGLGATFRFTLDEQYRPVR
jgi:signal transduction histidine kinase